MTESDEAVEELWRLPFGHPEIDPYRLANAPSACAGVDDLDFRTRLLIRDSLIALAGYWGGRRFYEWLDQQSTSAHLRSIMIDDELSPPGFTSFPGRLRKPTTVQMLVRYIQRLGRRTSAPSTLYLCRRTALVLLGRFSRRLTRVEYVDEKANDLSDGWRDRVAQLGKFDHLTVFLLDPIDVLCDSLFNAAEDQDDFRCAVEYADRPALEPRARMYANHLNSEDTRLKRAEFRWYIVFGDRGMFIGSDNPRLPSPLS